MDERLVEWIRKHLKRGFDIDKLRQALLKEGHDAITVEQHLYHVSSLHEESRKKKIRIRAILVVVLLLVFSAAAYYFSGFKQEQGSIEVIDQNKVNERKLDVLNKALIANDANLCNKLPENDREDCKSHFIRKKTECDENCMDQKLLNKALIQNNGSVCFEIRNNQTKSQCQKSFV